MYISSSELLEAAHASSPLHTGRGGMILPPLLVWYGMVPDILVAYSRTYQHANMALFTMG
jgi:hypothetical protein